MKHKRPHLQPFNWWVRSVDHVKNSSNLMEFMLLCSLKITLAKTMLTFAPLCEHHLPNCPQQHVELPVAQFHPATQSVSDKRSQRRQPVSIRLSAESSALAEGHHDLAECDVQGQRLYC